MGTNRRQGTLQGPYHRRSQRKKGRKEKKRAEEKFYRDDRYTPNSNWYHKKQEVKRNKEKGNRLTPQTGREPVHPSLLYHTPHPMVLRLNPETQPGYFGHQWVVIYSHSIGALLDA